MPSSTSPPLRKTRSEASITAFAFSASPAPAAQRGKRHLTRSRLLQTPGNPEPKLGVVSRGGSHVGDRRASDAGPAEDLLEERIGTFPHPHPAAAGDEEDRRTRLSHAAPPFYPSRYPGPAGSPVSREGTCRTSRAGVCRPRSPQCRRASEQTLKNVACVPRHPLPLTVFADHVKSDTV